MASTSIPIVVSHAISYLTRPLIKSYPASTIVKLQLLLEANLTALYGPTWDPANPLSGSGRRCLTLSPDRLPPRVIYTACLACEVQWFDWIRLLGGVEFDFFVDPGCISIRLNPRDSPNGRTITVWADEIPSPAVARQPVPRSFEEPFLRERNAYGHMRSYSQQFVADDDLDDVFTISHEEIKAPWMGPILNFPATIRSTSPLSTVSSHSRCSSRSSNSSSSGSTNTSPSKPKLSRRERARQARVFVDTSKNEVTPYDGGKTTVLTGGVMLGGGKAKKSSVPRSAEEAWRVPLRVL